MSRMLRRTFVVFTFAAPCSISSVWAQDTVRVRGTVEGMDGVYFDASLKRVYVSGGRGFDVGSVFVYQQHDADHYTQIGIIPTASGAGTSFWSPELNRLPARADR